jgi:hypothetical protein
MTNEAFSRVKIDTQLKAEPATLERCERFVAAMVYSERVGFDEAMSTVEELAERLASRIGKGTLSYAEWRATAGWNEQDRPGGQEKLRDRATAPPRKPAGRSPKQ